MIYYNYTFNKKDFDYLTRNGNTAHPKSKGGILRLLHSITPLDLKKEISEDWNKMWNKIQKSKGRA